MLEYVRKNFTFKWKTSETEKRDRRRERALAREKKRDYAEWALYL